MQGMQRSLCLQVLVIAAIAMNGCADNTSADPAPNAPSMTDTVEMADAGTMNDSSNPDVNAAPLTPDTLIARVATAVCEQLESCCNAADADTYFTTLRDNVMIQEAGLATTFPPNVPTTDFDCVSALTTALEIAPFGPWVKAVEDGRVQFDQTEADACMKELASAECGVDATIALFDSQCYGLLPPASGLSPRRMFQRTSKIGDTCMPLTDGVGAAIYGTCDPATGWCCRKDETGACGLSENTEGVCVAAGSVGESCGLMPTMQFCKTGLDCGQAVCEEMSFEALSLGDTCYENFELKGDCEDSFCDLFGTGRCESLKPNGDACLSPDECIAGACTAGVCAQPSFCSTPGAWSEPQTTEPVVPASKIEAGALEVARLLEGKFSSLAQSQTDPTYFNIHLSSCLVNAPGYGNLVLYVEQASGDTLTQPYRQRLYVITGDGATVQSEIWAPVNAMAWVGTCNKAETVTVSDGDFSLRAGCDVYLQADDSGYVGGTEGDQCKSTLAGASYATSKVTLDASLLLSWDQGFNSGGIQVWGATAGPYRFDRLTSIVSSADWAAKVASVE